jgi:hypothetical protein
MKSGQKQNSHILNIKAPKGKYFFGYDIYIIENGHTFSASCNCVHKEALYMYCSFAHLVKVILNPMMNFSVA